MQKVQDIFTVICIIALTNADVSHLSRQYLPPISRTTSFTSGSGYSTGAKNSFARLSGGQTLHIGSSSSYNTVGVAAPSKQVVASVSVPQVSHTYSLSKGVGNGNVNTIASAAVSPISQASTHIGGYSTGGQSLVASPSTQHTSSKHLSSGNIIPSVSSSVNHGHLGGSASLISIPARQYVNQQSHTTFTKQAYSSGSDSSLSVKQFSKLPAASIVPTIPKKQYIPPTPANKQSIFPASVIPAIPSTPKQLYTHPSHPVKQYKASTPAHSMEPGTSIKQYISPSTPVKQFISAAPVTPVHSIRPIEKNIPAVASTPLEKYVPPISKANTPYQKNSQLAQTFGSIGAATGIDTQYAVNGGYVY